MGDILNLGNAILILGCLYLGYKYGFDWFLGLLILLASVTWAYYGFRTERKELMKAKIALLKAKTKFYDRKEA